MGRDPPGPQPDGPAVSAGAADGEAHAVRQHDAGVVMDRDAIRGPGGARARGQQCDAGHAARRRLRRRHRPGQWHPAAQRAARPGRVLHPCRRRLARHQRPLRRRDVRVRVGLAEPSAAGIRDRRLPPRTARGRGDRERLEQRQRRDDVDLLRERRVVGERRGRAGHWQRDGGLWRGFAEGVLGGVHGGGLGETTKE